MVIKPFFDGPEFHRVQYVNGCVHYVSLHPTGGCESGWESVIDEETTVDLDDKKTLVWGPDRNCAICSLNVESSCLCPWRCCSHLNEDVIVSLRKKTNRKNKTPE